jgi:hypothetical protein
LKTPYPDTDVFDLTKGTYTQHDPDTTQEDTKEAIGSVMNLLSLFLSALCFFSCDLFLRQVSCRGEAMISTPADAEEMSGVEMGAEIAGVESVGVETGGVETGGVGTAGVETGGVGEAGEVGGEVDSRKGAGNALPISKT